MGIVVACTRVFLKLIKLHTLNSIFDHKGRQAADSNLFLNNEKFSSDVNRKNTQQSGTPYILYVSIFGTPNSAEMLGWPDDKEISYL